MEDYPSNSHKSKEKQQLEKVVNGVTATKKKSGVSKLSELLISDDASDVKNYILIEVIIPSIKKAIYDVFTNGIDMILYGSKSGHKNYNQSTASKISYRSYYDNKKSYYEPNRSVSNRSSFDYDNILFSNRGDAEAVVSEMENVIEKFGWVSVGDLYDLADISTTNYAVNKYGWYDITSANVVRNRDGYIIKFPKAVPLD